MRSGSEEVTIVWKANVAQTNVTRTVVTSSNGHREQNFMWQMRLHALPSLILIESQPMKSFCCCCGGGVS